MAQKTLLVRLLARGAVISRQPNQAKLQRHRLKPAPSLVAAALGGTSMATGEDKMTVAPMPVSTPAKEGGSLKASKPSSTCWKRPRTLTRTA